MSKQLALVCVIVTSAGVASADPDVVKLSTDHMDDQSIGADLGAAAGGRVTPGGLRIAGHYLYQLTAHDWFDGAASFTYGGGGAACYRDRMETFMCDHGAVDGDAVEISLGVRHMFAAQGKYTPFVRGGFGFEIAHYAADGVSGFAVPLHAGGGVRAQIDPSIAIVGEAEVVAGAGIYGHGLGFEPQLGAAFVAGAEFRLR